MIGRFKFYIQKRDKGYLILFYQNEIGDERCWGIMFQFFVSNINLKGIDSEVFVNLKEII